MLRHSLSSSGIRLFEKAQLAADNSSLLGSFLIIYLYKYFCCERAHLFVI